MTTHHSIGKEALGSGAAVQNLDLMLAGTP